MLKAWLSAGSLVEIERLDEKRRPRAYVEVADGG